MFCIIVENNDDNVQESQSLPQTNEIIGVNDGYQRDKNIVDVHVSTSNVHSQNVADTSNLNASATKGFSLCNVYFELWISLLL